MDVTMCLSVLLTRSLQCPSPPVHHPIYSPVQPLSIPSYLHVFPALFTGLWPECRLCSGPVGLLINPPQWLLTYFSLD